MIKIVLAKKSVPKRHKAVRIALFSHKGGVGKTTLTVNIADAIAALNKNVLLVDSDPQCNLTSYLTQADVVDKWLDESDSDDGRTIWTALKPVVEATGDPRYIDPVERSKNIFLLPGDVRLSEFEQDLNQQWSECIERKLRGFKGTSALSSVVNQLSAKLNIDYVFYDVGPNIGPLNRVILLDCDYFIIPAACDLFSRRALKTLGHTLDNWIRNWATISDLAPDNVPLLLGAPKFLGYVLQRFRMYGGEITNNFSSFVSPLEKAISSDIVTVLRRIDPALATGTMNLHRLGRVKDFSSLASMAQVQGVPFRSVNGVSDALRLDASIAFEEIAKKIVQRSAGQ